MWMSNVLIVVDRNNPDGNGVADIASALVESGAVVLGVDEQRWLIEATLPAHEVPVVTAMEGVSYVRSVFTYLSGEGQAEAA
jgi:hypothetical protein